MSRSATVRRAPRSSCSAAPRCSSVSAAALRLRSAPVPRPRTSISPRCSAATPRCSAVRRRSSTAAGRRATPTPSCSSTMSAQVVFRTPYPRRSRTAAAVPSSTCVPSSTTSPACRRWSSGATSRRNAMCSWWPLRPSTASRRSAHASAARSPSSARSPTTAVCWCAMRCSATHRSTCPSRCCSARRRA